MGYSYTIKGVEDIQRAFELKRKEIEEILMRDVGEGADMVKSSAKSKAPKDLHNLEKAIDRNEVWNKGGKISVYVGVGIVGLFNEADGRYARMQEYGTSLMKANPYLRPAFNEAKASIKNKMMSDIKEVLE